MKYIKYEEELDEVLMSQNPKGGRPQKIGSRVYLSLERATGFSEADSLKEETQIRYCLGYCACSRKIVMGEKRARLLLEALKREGIVHEERKIPVRLRIARLLLSGQPYIP